MMKLDVSIEHVVEFLNEALKIDRIAISSLLTASVVCNRDMSDHWSVQAWEADENGDYHVRMIGVINGIFGVDEEGWGGISAIVDTVGKSPDPGLIQKFVVRENWLRKRRHKE